MVTGEILQPLQIAIALALAATPVMAQDYSLVERDGRTLAQIGWLGRNCPQIGYEFSSEGFQALVSNRIALWEAAGLDLDQARQRSRLAMDRRMAELNAPLEAARILARTSPSDLGEALGRFAADLEVDCKSASEAFPNTFIADGDEDSGRILTRLMNTIEEMATDPGADPE